VNYSLTVRVPQISYQNVCGAAELGGVEGRGAEVALVAAEGRAVVPRGDEDITKVDTHEPCPRKLQIIINLDSAFGSDLADHARWNRPHLPHTTSKRGVL
jgi:hypothetical protein